jgi:hypothetical protein
LGSPSRYAQRRRCYFLGDGEFDGSQLQQALTNAGWEYVVALLKIAKSPMRATNLL